MPVRENRKYFVFICHATKADMHNCKPLLLNLCSDSHHYFAKFINKIVRCQNKTQNGLKEWQCLLCSWICGLDRDSRQLTPVPLYGSWACTWAAAGKASDLLLTHPPVLSPKPGTQLGTGAAGLLCHSPLSSFPGISPMRRLGVPGLRTPPWVFHRCKRFLRHITHHGKGPVRWLIKGPVAMPEGRNLILETYLEEGN